LSGLRHNPNPNPIELAEVIEGTEIVLTAELAE
jgi:hypothetical protein